MDLALNLLSRPQMRNIEMMVFPEFSVMSLAAVSVFEMANRRLESGFYEIRLTSELGGLVEASVGIKVDTVPFSESGRDTLIVPGADRLINYSTQFTEFLRNAPHHFDRIVGMCTGAFALAEAGLLNGKRATTHWYFGAQMKSRFPLIRMSEDRIFVIDDQIWTSAGMSAGTDMALAMVEADLGPEIARQVSKALVMYGRRAGGQLQFSPLLELSPKSDRLQTALAFAAANLEADLTVEQLAKIAGLSSRQFSRAFRLETGESPARAMARLRVESARKLLESGTQTLDEIARQTGFNDRERMRKAFVEVLGQPPQTVRRNSRTNR